MLFNVEEIVITLQYRMKGLNSIKLNRYPDQDYKRLKKEKQDEGLEKLKKQLIKENKLM